MSLIKLQDFQGKAPLFTQAIITDKLDRISNDTLVSFTFEPSENEKKLESIKVDGTANMPLNVNKEEGPLVQT